MATKTEDQKSGPTDRENADFYQDQSKKGYALVSAAVKEFDVILTKLREGLTDLDNRQAEQDAKDQTYGSSAKPV